MLSGSTGQFPLRQGISEASRAQESPGSFACRGRATAHVRRDADNPEIRGRHADDSLGLAASARVNVDSVLFSGQRPDFDKFATWRRPDAAGVKLTVVGGYGIIAVHLKSSSCVHARIVGRMRFGRRSSPLWPRRRLRSGAFLARPILACTGMASHRYRRPQRPAPRPPPLAPHAGSRRAYEQGPRALRTSSQITDTCPRICAGWGSPPSRSSR